MAYYVNVTEWSPEQVADWIRGMQETPLPSYKTCSLMYYNINIFVTIFSGLLNS